MTSTRYTVICCNKIMIKLKIKGGEEEEGVVHKIHSKTSKQIQIQYLKLYFTERMDQQKFLIYYSVKGNDWTGGRGRERKAVRRVGGGGYNIIERQKKFLVHDLSLIQNTENVFQLVFWMDEICVLINSAAISSLYNI